MVPAALPQPPLITVNEYVPEPAVVTDAIVGFCKDDVKLLGPLQEYEVPVVFPVKLSVDPEHTGELLVGAGEPGEGLTVTEVAALRLKHPAAEMAVTEYVPPAAVVTLLIVGFCAEFVNEFGPTQL